MTTGVQTGELGKLGTDLTASAGVVHDQVGKIADNMIGPGEVGAKYSDQGTKIQAGLEAVRGWLEEWAQATTNSGNAVGAAEISFSTVDQENAAATTNAGG